MNKKDLIDKLNKVKIYKILNKDIFKLNNLHLNKNPGKISKNLLDQVAEIFPLNPDQIQKEAVKNSEKTVEKMTEIKTLFNVREIHHFVREKFQKEAKKSETKGLESPLNQRFPFRTETPQKALSNPADHFLSAPFKQVETQTRHKGKKREDNIKKFPVFSAEKETMKIKPQTGILQNLNAPKKPTGTMRFDPPAKQFEDRPLKEKSKPVPKDTPLFTPKRTGRRNPSQAENLTKAAPVLFPKPERDALLAILKDIQHKVSEKKPAHIMTREVRSSVSSPSRDLHAALRQTIR